MASDVLLKNQKISRRNVITYFKYAFVNYYNNYITESILPNLLQALCVAAKFSILRFP